MAAAASPNGILRQPRYSSSLSSSASATTNDNNDVAIVADVTPPKAASSDSDNNSPHDHPTTRPPLPSITTPPPSSLTPATTMPSNSGGGGGYGGGTSRKYPLRSLAEMVKSVTELNNEAQSLDFSRVNDTTTDGDDCNIVHSKSKSASSMSSSGERSNHNTVLHATENSNYESNNNPLLLISNNGIPYMNMNNNNSSITSSSTRPNDDTTADASKNPIIAAAVGVMGDNGQGVVRFCELEEVRDEGSKTITTIRDRLGGDQNTIIDMDNPISDTNMLKKGRTNTTNDNDEDETAESDSESYGSNEGGDEDILQELGMSNFFTNSDNNNKQDDDDEEEEYYDNVINDQQHHVRPFRILWEILTRWATPSTVELVLTYQRMQQYEEQTLQQDDNIHEHGSSSKETTAATVPRNDVDIGASRQAGIMSMLKMHVPRALAELQRIQQRGEVILVNNNNTAREEENNGIGNQKLVEQRLATLVRTFNPSVPAINLNTKLWKGLTTILIGIAFPNSTVVDDDSIVVLPPSILVLDMTAAEYRYLTCSVYTSLCNVD